VIVPISAWLMGVIGRKRFYMLCVTLFTGSSLLWGLAPRLGTLIFFAFFRGWAAAAWCRASTDPRRHVPAGAARASVCALPHRCHRRANHRPTLGGWITDHWSRHWIFFVNVPIGIVSLACAVAADRTRGAPGRAPAS